MCLKYGFGRYLWGCELQGAAPEARISCSGTLLPERLRRLSHQSRQPDQVVRRATEDEQPVNFLQASQLDLAPVSYTHLDVYKRQKQQLT